MKINLTVDEIFELTEMVGNRMESDRDLIPLYEKLCKHLPKPKSYTSADLDYEIPFYEPKIIKEKS
jgi:hypothetical protein|tara:strand:+ start:502 stop:699 length:198 start_codon:yes stop_codon:yes gene_type:complete